MSADRLQCASGLLYSGLSDCGEARVRTRPCGRTAGTPERPTRAATFVLPIKTGMSSVLTLQGGREDGGKGVLSLAERRRVSASARPPLAGDNWSEAANRGQGVYCFPQEMDR